METSKVTYKLIKLLEQKRLQEKLTEVQKQVKKLQSKLNQQEIGWDSYESQITPLTKKELKLMSQLSKRVTQ
jgi:7-keto-8-aminopelargonate synthetase-like enzyme